MLRTLVALCDGALIGVDDLPPMIRPASLAMSAADVPPLSLLEDAERLALLKVLTQQRWHMTLVAERLGVSRNTLYRKLRKHGIELRSAL